MIIPRSQHTISRKNISSNALKVLNRLHEAGYEAYLVGGSVRDLLLGKLPKDFDVATNALPEDVKKIFRNCRIIGRRFRLAHVFFGPDIIEVATFRASHTDGPDGHGQMRDGMIIRDNVYGSLKDDAWRRDFRINALYYNIADYSVVDFTGGMSDLKKRSLQMIGDAATRYKEDPVRMLRAIRFADKLDLTIDKKTALPLSEQAHLLAQIPPSRLFEELLKLFLTGHALKSYQQLQKFSLLKPLLPMTFECLKHDPEGIIAKFIHLALENTDKRVQEGKSVTPAFLFSVLLWEPIQVETAQHRKNNMPPMIAMEKAINHVLAEQNKFICIPRRFTHSMRAIWAMQPLLFRRHGKNAFRLIEQPRFRAAYDFLLLRAEAGEKVNQVANWWEKFTVADAAEREKLIKELPKPPRRRSR